MHATFESIFKQEALIIGRRAMYRQNVSAIQLQGCRQCSKCHALRREQLIVLEPHGRPECLARSLCHPAVMISANRRQLQALEALECLARPQRAGANIAEIDGHVGTAMRIAASPYAEASCEA